MIAEPAGAIRSAAAAAMIALLEEIAGDLELDRPDRLVGDPA